MGWFWADKDTTASTVAPKATTTSLAKCPVDHGKFKPASCPVVATESSNDELNPLNNMPYTISTQKAPGQTIDLPTEKTLSTIPRGTDANQGVWEYPSPQQMLNAMLRKGKGDIPEDAVESMVNIHNFLNEGAWDEILKWEEPYIRETKMEPRLEKFTGKPKQLTPRAWIYHQLSKVFPDKYNTELPFDRHDWTVLRSDGNGNWVPVRYVIDYYGGPEDEDGMPTFFLDVRPGLDNFTNAMDRFNHWKAETKPVWDKAMGQDGKN
ncbi:unnamed protein product [Ambrosiozyma monospora]|uniref:Holocytochrome c-type synthase n=1 Tax=Ambrosiozyma monospora TaxID=43982 RepID=A0A9W6YSA0_AMBMO|nr:unnamed protein product [Ambrosiozyma monospora]